MSDGESPTITAPAPSPTSGFKRVAATVDAEDTSESAGFELQRAAAEKAREDDLKGSPTGFFRDAASKGGENGFTISGRDGAGNGFEHSLDSSFFGHRWTSFKPQWFMSEGHAQHYQSLNGGQNSFNKKLDKIIARAIEHKWTMVGLETGLVGKVAASPVLVNALNRRIQELAAGQTKDSQRTLRMMGYKPVVMEQLKNLRAYPGHIDDVLEAMRPTAPPSAPVGAPAGGSPPPRQP
jgi:hypothetical protein